jgi:hypothetical protein
VTVSRIFSPVGGQEWYCFQIFSENLVICLLYFLYRQDRRSPGHLRDSVAAGPHKLKKLLLKSGLCTGSESRSFLSS